MPNRFSYHIAWVTLLVIALLLAGCAGGNSSDQGTKTKQPERPKMELPAPPEGMIKIPAGEFIMGTNQRHPDEGPEMKLTLPEYYADPFEVTNEDYTLFVADTGHEAPDHWPGGVVPEGREKHPVTYVDWDDAKAYCKWRGKQLPTQAMWEKAARGVKGQWFPWGPTFDATKANTPQTKIGDTMPVGSFPQGNSPYGLSDVSGNVWEWTEDWYLPYPNNQSPSANYGKVYRTTKGGSWYDCTFYRCGISAPSFNRAFLLPETRNDSTGFRCFFVAKGVNMPPTPGTGSSDASPDASAGGSK